MRAAGWQLRFTHRRVEFDLEARPRLPGAVGEEALLRYYGLLGSIELKLVPPVTPEEEGRWTHLAAAKDLHVLAGANKAGADFQVSLDRRHILTEVIRKGFPIVTQNPGEFLQSIVANV
jgi:hypothetical protein